MKKLLLALLILLSISFQTTANHLLGGYIYCKPIGNDFYDIEVKVYRDCDINITTGFDDPLKLSVFDSLGNAIVVLDMAIFNSYDIQPADTHYCPGYNNYCVQYGYYRNTIQLPSIPGGYDIVYQRCCKINTYLNIVDPGNAGCSFKCHIPMITGQDTLVNSNPVYSDSSFFIYTVNTNFQFDLMAIDADGDSLAYSLCTPYNGPDAADPMPDTAVSELFPVIWANGYDTNNVLGGGSSFSIDYNGILSGYSANLGKYVFAICIDEYRNGILINTNKIERSIYIVDCATKLTESYFSNSKLFYNDGLITAKIDKSLPDYTIKIFDIIGREIFSKHLLNEGELVIPVGLNEKSKGIYSIVLIGDAGQKLFSQKVVN